MQGNAIKAVRLEHGCSSLSKGTPNDEKTSTVMASDSFGEFLIQEGWIRREQLNMAIALQQEIGGDIGEVLVALSILTSQQVSNIRRKWMDDNTIAIPLVPAPQEFLASFGIESPPDLVSLEKLFALDITNQPRPNSR